MTKKVFLASDHAGFELKEALEAFLSERGYEVIDAGPATLDKNDDYPDTLRALIFELSQDPNAMGIVAGYSGQGEAMACNRTKGLRAAVYYGGNSDVLKLSREHNNANILSIGAGFLSIQEAKDAALLWLTTDFSGDERHVRRIAKLN